ncbi:hypothetical protein SAMN05216386_0200 [Nitrosospira briensis]|uniref:Uncharacterized protein n=1 Tax=Nitrosospira briensis TaxID=35799 RepID=A0A1I4XLM3_9PROT|nr:hypothetical protein SAMN05216386_0200 [Nitrosospira briensis]SFO00671.1 hypothetical protein SAMN05216332_103174 [Nitrosospira briensis]
MAGQLNGPICKLPTNLSTAIVDKKNIPLLAEITGASYIMALIKEPLNEFSVDATAALGMGMRERGRREWHDREGWSGAFRRKVRPRSGM